MEDTTIYYTKTTGQIYPNNFENYLKKLPFREQSRVLRYHHLDDQLRCIIGISLIDHLVFKGEISKLDTLKYNYFGKPYTDHNGFFNISHSDDVVIIAVSQKFEMGIDIEKIVPITLTDFKKQMTALEWKRVSCCSGNQKKEFYNYWTQKEAVIKALGRGLSISLQSFEIIDLKTSIFGNDYYLKELDISENYCCHIASTDRRLKISSPIFIESSYLIS